MTTTTNAVDVANQLVDLCRQGRNMEAIERFYSPDVVSVEAQATPAAPAEAHGIDQVRAKNQWWLDNNTIHDATVDGPYPHNDRFAVKYFFDVTPHDGPMAGQRFQMNEIALYTVEEGRIVREEFFYNM